MLIDKITFYEEKNVISHFTENQCNTKGYGKLDFIQFNFLISWFEMKPKWQDYVIALT